MALPAIRVAGRDPLPIGLSGRRIAGGLRERALRERKQKKCDDGFIHGLLPSPVPIVAIV
jgi:hypothetical protein